MKRGQFSSCFCSKVPDRWAQKGSRTPIDPDDARMQDVTYQNGILWGTLNTVVNVDGETVNRSGTAWFAIKPQLEHGQLTQAGIFDQGYLAVRGEYLLYAALTMNIVIVLRSRRGEMQSPSFFLWILNIQSGHVHHRTLLADKSAVGAINRPLRMAG